MENSTIWPRGLENGASRRATLGEVDPAAKKDGKVDCVAVTILPTDAPPKDVMQENRAPKAKTPTAAGAFPLRKPLPFRERNMEEGRRLLPPYIKVPPKKLFGYPERYRSPTDAMVSPVSRGLLSRNRRPARTLAPAVPPKALENTFQDVVVDILGG